MLPYVSAALGDLSVVVPVPNLDDVITPSSLFPRLWPKLLTELMKDALEETVLVRLGVEGKE
jgi:hypothetical protein